MQLVEHGPSPLEDEDVCTGEVTGRVLAALVATTARVTLLCEPDGTVIWVSPSLGPLLGLAPDAILGTMVEPGARSGVDRLVLGGNGRPHRIDVFTTDLCDDPSVGGLLVEWTVRPQSGLFGRDPVTGLFTLARLVERAAATGPHGDAGVAVIRLRADRDLADDALRHVAHRLMHALRAGDLAARSAGGDFVVVCPGRWTLTDATNVAQRLRSTINGPVRVAAGITNIRLAAGVATGDTGSLDTLLRYSEHGLIPGG